MATPRGTDGGYGMSDGENDLDRYIAEHVMGWRWWRFSYEKDRWCQLVPQEDTWPKTRKKWNGIICKCAVEGLKDCTDLSLFKPSTDPAAAMSVLERCAEQLGHTPDIRMVNYTPCCADVTCAECRTFLERTEL